MYIWRKINLEQQYELMHKRRQRQYPFHSPPHFQSVDDASYMLSAANYEHKALIYKHVRRIDTFAQDLCSTLSSDENKLHSWCVLPNHWHSLITCKDLKKLLSEIGKLHGRSSYYWNKEENMQGRKCWHGCMDRRIRSKAHFMAARNYIHLNPVKHVYVQNWNDWPYSSLIEFLQKKTEEEAVMLLKEFPIDKMGESWDVL